ncbi:MAG: DNA helicase UvrD [Candidatus Magasanikbacteria bacterium]|nr:DNA helicase UvrD [Candidatus Magasanikbacteria bacterium]
MKQIVDLHIHSKYARACSPLLEIPNIAKACEQKGINICGSGDFTHPSWFAHLENEFKEISKTGLYTWKNGTSPTKFILTSEIACIYKHRDKVRRVHLILVAPNLEAAGKLNAALSARGVNLRSDGRPIMGLHAKEVLKMMLAIDKRFMMIPAHAWTPWFAVFGSKSGYNSLEECFEELTPHIKAIETGLSSDPTMNHQLSALDNIVLVSNSDAHSLDNLGREANVFAFESEKEITYDGVRDCIESNDQKKFLYTIEFYPEEGMYHVDGHRACGISMEPKETKKNKKICPKCKKELTIGVLHRVSDLADREVKDIKPGKFIPHKYIVPLREIIAEAFEVGKGSKKVQAEYDNLIKKLGSEFFILLEAGLEKVKAVVSNQNIYLGLKNMRASEVVATPGFDGQYGKVQTIKSRISAAKQAKLI